MARAYLDKARHVALPPLTGMWWGLPVLTGVYFVAGKFGLRLAFEHASATVMWPPTGIAMAAILLYGYRMWPAVFVGTLLVNATTAGSGWTSLGIAMGNALEGLLGVWLVSRWANGRAVFDEAKDTVKFVALAGLVGTTVSATVGVTSLAIGGYADWDRFGAIWLTWWLGDVAGVLVVTPILVLWGTDRRVQFTWREALELSLVLASVVVVGGIVFDGLGPAGASSYPLEFLCIPPLVFAAFRVGQREAATCVALLAGIATKGTLDGFGPFVRSSQNESLVLLQAFLGTLAIMTLSLAAVVREHARGRAAFVRAAAIVTSSDDAIIGKTLDGIITTWNEGAERLYGYSPPEVIGQPISIIIPPEQGGELPRILERLRRGERVDNYETVWVGKGGRRIDVAVTVSPIRDENGRVVGASSIARDITHRKEIEATTREQDTLRSVASLAAGAAHEINNPLTVVMGHAQLLTEEVLGTGRQRIAEILDAVARIHAVTTRMKHLTRIEMLEASPHLPPMLDITKSSEPNTDGGAEAAFASLQDTSRSLVIVARESASRYADLKEMFDLDVILDRRMAERRQRQISVQVERRQGDRRGRDITTDLRTRGWAAVGR